MQTKKKIYSAATTDTDIQPKLAIELTKPSLAPPLRTIWDFPTHLNKINSCFESRSVPLRYLQCNLPAELNIRLGYHHQYKILSVAVLNRYDTGNVLGQLACNGGNKHAGCQVCTRFCRM